MPIFFSVWYLSQPPKHVLPRIKLKQSFKRGGTSSHSSYKSEVLSMLFTTPPNMNMHPSGDTAAEWKNSGLGRVCRKGNNTYESLRVVWNSNYSQRLEMTQFNKISIMKPWINPPWKELIRFSNRWSWTLTKWVFEDNERRNQVILSFWRFYNEEEHSTPFIQ